MACAAPRASTVVPATLFGPLLTGGRLGATQAVTLVRNAGYRGILGRCEPMDGERS